MNFFVAILKTFFSFWKSFKVKYFLYKIIKSPVILGNKIIFVDYSPIPISINHLSKTPIYLKTTFDISFGRVLYNKINLIKNWYFESKVSQLNFDFHNSTMRCTLLYVNVNLFKNVRMVLNIKIIQSIHNLVVKVRRFVLKSKFLLYVHFLHIGWHKFWIIFSRLWFLLLYEVATLKNTWLLIVWLILYFGLH